MKPCTLPQQNHPLVSRLEEFAFRFNEELKTDEISFFLLKEQSKVGLKRLSIGEVVDSKLD